MRNMPGFPEKQDGTGESWQAVIKAFILGCPTEPFVF
jgi:hypothetical protein